MMANEQDSGVDIVHECFPERKQFYSKCLLLGALASEAARQPTIYIANRQYHMISQGCARARIGDVDMM